VVAECYRNINISRGVVADILVKYLFLFEGGGKVHVRTVSVIASNIPPSKQGSYGRFTVLPKVSTCRRLRQAWKLVRRLSSKGWAACTIAWSTRGSVVLGTTAAVITAAAPPFPVMPCSPPVAPACVVCAACFAGNGSGAGVSV